MFFLAQGIEIPPPPPGVNLPPWLQTLIYVAFVLGPIAWGGWQKFQASRKTKQLEAVIKGVEVSQGAAPHPETGVTAPCPPREAIQAVAISDGVEEQLNKTVAKVKDTARLARPPEDAPQAPT